MSLLGKIFSTVSPVGILGSSIKAVAKGVQPPIVKATEPIRSQYITSKGLGGIYGDVTATGKEFTGGDAFKLLSGTIPKATNPTVNPGTNEPSPTVRTPGISPEPIPVLFDTNNGLNPLWLLVALVVVLFGKRFVK